MLESVAAERIVSYTDRSWRRAGRTAYVGVARRVADVVNGAQRVQDLIEGDQNAQPAEKLLELDVALLLDVDQRRLERH